MVRFIITANIKISWKIECKIVRIFLSISLHVCFGWEIRQIIFNCSLLSKDLKTRIIFGRHKYEKTCLQALQTTKVQTSLRICTVWSVPLLLAYWKVYLNSLQAKSHIFYLVSVAEQTNLSLTWSEIPKTGFLALRPIFCVGKINDNSLTLWGPETPWQVLWQTVEMQIKCRIRPRQNKSSEKEM